MIKINRKGMIRTMLEIKGEAKKKRKTMKAICDGLFPGDAAKYQWLRKLSSRGCSSLTEAQWGDLKAIADHVGVNALQILDGTRYVRRYSVADLIAIGARWVAEHDGEPPNDDAGKITKFAIREMLSSPIASTLKTRSIHDAVSMVENKIVFSKPEGYSTYGRPSQRKNNDDKTKCERCLGYGHLGKCKVCNGDGYLHCEPCDGIAGDPECLVCLGQGDIDCPECNQGYVKCNRCNGDGVADPFVQD